MHTQFTRVHTWADAHRHIHMYTGACTCVVGMCTHVYTGTRVQRCMHTRVDGQGTQGTSTCVHIGTHVHTYTQVHTCTHRHVHTRAHGHMKTCIQRHMHTHAQCTHRYTHTCTHRHVRTHSPMAMLAQPPPAPVVPWSCGPGQPVPHTRPRPRALPWGLTPGQAHTSGPQSSIITAVHKNHLVASATTDAGPPPGLLTDPSPATSLSSQGDSPVPALHRPAPDYPSPLPRTPALPGHPPATTASPSGVGSRV